MAADPRRVEIVDRHGARRWHELWEGNPRIARPGERGDFQRLVNGPGVRPYHREKRDDRWVFNPDYRATPAELHFTAAERKFAQRHAGHIVLEPMIKAKASPNKQWGWVRWNKLAWLMQRRGYRVTQIGGLDTPLMDGGVDFVVTRSFREACAVLSTATAAVLPEGGLHHAAAAVGLPAVVIFGGFTPVELTGYAGHVNLGASLGDACGSRLPCKHCAQWMARIAPEAVFDELERILERNQGMARPVAA